MKREELYELGFTELPHFTIMESLIYDLGRGRHLSFGSIGTPNEMLFLCQKDNDNERKLSDAICLRNYDYDGYTTIEEIKQIINALTNNK